jgi:uncharacterized protein YprB with RNaseH-like and TPR domain
VCISAGYIKKKGKETEFRIKSCAGNDEVSILHEFKSLVEQYKQNELQLCAHNGKEFDFPYIIRRMIINNVELPESLTLFGKKPWEVKHIDTMEMWRFGDYKQFTSLKLLCDILQIPTPKDEMEGSMVAGYFYSNKLDEIINYCQKDVLAVANVFLRYMNKPIITNNQVKVIS